MRRENNMKMNFRGMNCVAGRGDDMSNTELEVPPAIQLST
jgi:hypothetical protein